jgi:hypothetical protein
MSQRTLLGGMILLLVSMPLIAQQPTERIDRNVIHRIKTAEIGGEGGGFGGRGARGSAPPIMETLYNLTDRYGPRLTNSPQFRAAGEWAVKQLNEWGLSDVHLEKWATGSSAGRTRAAIPGWEFTEYEGAMVEPSYMPIIGYPQAWSGSTDGKVTGEAMMAPGIETMAEMDKLHGTLKGKILLLGTGHWTVGPAVSGYASRRPLHRCGIGCPGSRRASLQRRRARWPWKPRCDGCRAGLVRGRGAGLVGKTGHFLEGRGRAVDHSGAGRPGSKRRCLGQ